MIALSRLTPLVARARPRLGLSNDYHQGAALSWEISPACVTETPGAIFDEGDLPGITGVYPGNTIAMEGARRHARSPVL